MDVIPHERRRWPTLTHAIYVVGEMESRRRWMKDLGPVVGSHGLNGPSPEELNTRILELVDWAICDVDVAELERFIEETRSLRAVIDGPSMAELVGSSEFVNAASILWDLMTHDEKDGIRWLFIERCHEARFNCKLMGGVPHGTCPRCLTTDQAPDPACTVCRQVHGIPWTWEGNPEDGVEAAEGQDLRASA